MNVVILTAGGKGTRMHNKVPKQFMMIKGKPLIVYTAEKFQRSNSVDIIIVVCLSGWIKKMKEYADEYKLSKIRYITAGGKSGQESIFNGLQVVRDHFPDDSIVMIHDGNRPLVSNEMIDESIRTCKEKGNAVAYIPCQEVMFVSDDMESSKQEIEREKLARTQTPHVYRARDLYHIFELASKHNLTDCVAVCSMCCKLGIKTYLYPGSEKNIKITTPIDVDIFEALLNRKDNE